jgi:hypothetical protein
MTDAVQWSDLNRTARIERIQAACTPGADYREMIGQLGENGVTGVGRNALIGFFHRNGKELRRFMPSQSVPKPRSAAARAQSKAKKRAASKPHKKPAIEIPDFRVEPMDVGSVPSEPMVQSKPILFLDYEPHQHCDYPLWGVETVRVGEKKVCGAPCKEGSRRCEAHHEIMHRRKEKS